VWDYERRAENVALNKTATASSIQGAGYPASAAVDGSTTTRWSSLASDPQWLQVDLGSTQSICKVVLNWEAAYGKAFQIQTSSDATNWTSIYSTTTGTGGIQTLNIAGSGRYVRMYGTVRGTGYGYSLWELQVFGSFGTPDSDAHRGTHRDAHGDPRTDAHADPRRVWHNERRAEQAGDRIVDPGRRLPSLGCSRRLPHDPLVERL